MYEFFMDNYSDEEIDDDDEENDFSSKEINPISASKRSK